ncbi:MAG: ABC transporter ATP-binding protein [Clostridia bacterium]|nr:ABC transporter ATP-binding protein [Clostridia bacterium]
MKAEISKLSLDRLAVGYGGNALISDITLSLQPGEILTLIGPNGAGKTTILKSITGHLATIAGTVFIDNENMKTLSGKEVAKKLAVVLTDRIKPELMTCRELVAAGRYPYTGSFGMLTEHDNEIVDRALKAVHAEDLADRDVTEISDGQRQRILLARAICQEPEIIVLDEPTSFLDVKHKIELLEILRGMAKNDNITVVMSLHEIDLAQKVSDKIVCIKGDKIAAYGTPDEIFTDEKIADLYSIEHGSYSALFGSVELSRPTGEPKVFVIGGAGRGIPFYRALQKTDTPFAVGIIPKNDLDYPVAAALSENVIATEPYVAASDEQIAAAKKLIDSADYVLDTKPPVGEFSKYVEELREYSKNKLSEVIK